MHTAYGVLNAARRKGTTIFLAFSFFLGLLFGVFIFCRTEFLSLYLMRSSFFPAVSIVGSLSCILLPFLLSAFAVSFHLPWLICLICFTEALLYTYSSLFFILYYQPLGFTVRYLLLFVNFLSLPCMYLYWYIHLSKDRYESSWGTFFFLLAGFLIGFVDFYIAAPFGVIS